MKYTEMINFDDVRKENIKKHNRNWPEVLDRPNTIFRIGGSEPGKKIITQFNKSAARY